MAAATVAVATVPAEQRTVGRGVPSHVRRCAKRKEPMMEEQRAAPGEEEEVTDNGNYKFRSKHYRVSVCPAVYSFNE